jgi:hypothetical protein
MWTMDHPTSHDEDVYAWAYEQAALLRDLATTRRDLPNALDIENLCEEIEGLARTDLREAESFLRLIFLHLLKIASAPNAPALEHWKAELMVFQAGFATMCTRTILRKINAEKMWGLAVRQATTQLTLEGDQILPDLSVACPIPPQELATELFDIDAAIEAVRTSASRPPPA